MRQDVELGRDRKKRMPFFNSFAKYFFRRLDYLFFVDGYPKRPLDKRTRERILFFGFGAFSMFDDKVT